MPNVRSIYCCGCKKEVYARLTSGREIYPHRDDLYDLPFWKCEECGCYVGCHHKTSERTKPLGNMPTKEIRAVRMAIHRILDPMWMNAGRGKDRMIARARIYNKISSEIGYQYHTGEIKTVEEAKRVYRIVELMK